MGMLDRLRRAAAVVREVAADAREVAAELGREAARAAATAARRAAEDLADRVVAAPQRARSAVAPAVRRAAAATQAVAPRAAQELRAAAAPTKPPAKPAKPPRKRSARKVEPPPEPPAKPTKPRKTRAQTVIETNEARKAALGTGGSRKPPSARRGMTQQLGLVRVSPSCYVTREDHAEAVAKGALYDLTLWAERNAAAQTPTLGGAWRVAGQARWAESWQSLTLRWDGSSWSVMGQPPLAASVAEIVSNGEELSIRYGRDASRDKSNSKRLIVAVYLPIRPARK